MRHLLLSVQNAAAYLVTGTQQCDHIFTVVCQLHWLSVWQRVELKVANNHVKDNGCRDALWAHSQLSG